MTRQFAARRQTPRSAPAARLPLRRAPSRATALQRLADASPAVAHLAALQRLADAGPVQRQGEEEELMMKAAEPAQRQGLEEEELMQGAFADGAAQTADRGAATGDLPAQLREGVEALSGVSMDGVSVHRNSDAPAQVGAHAFAQGSEIHMASGQETHLPHEAWHVAQQRQGRVAATTEVNGAPVNDDAGLEREADTMGSRAMEAGRRR